MKEEFITWDELIRIPDPDAILTILLHVVAHFWRAEGDKDYYQSHLFPQDVSNVVLRIDHQMYKKPRYHLYEVGGGDNVGIWDDTPYHVEFREKEQKSFHLNHGELRHDFQLFLRSFLKHVKNHSKYYPSLDRMIKIIENFRLLQWKCSICQCYNEWSRDVIKTILKDNVPIAPASLLFLLTFKNNNNKQNMMDHQSQALDDLLMVALRRFFMNFEKIQEQTSADPLVILENFILILEKYLSIYTIDQIHEFEQECARDIKTYLYREFKYIKTRLIEIHYLPRDMMIIRDLFPMLISRWTSLSDAPSHDMSPGFLMLFYNMLFEDKVIHHKKMDNVMIVYHPLDGSLSIVRPMTFSEQKEIADYHPLLRPFLFQKS